MNRGRHILLSMLVGLAAGLAVAGLYATGVLKRFELTAADLRFAAAADPSDWPDDVVVVYIDRSSLQHLSTQLENPEFWPWHRQIYAEVGEYLRECGARVILLDFVFNEPSVYRGEDDAAFAELAAEIGGIYASASSVRKDVIDRYRRAGKLREVHLLGDRPPSEEAMRRWSIPLDRRDGLMELGMLTAPVRVLEPGLAGIGLVEMHPDEDGVVRRYAPVSQYKGNVLPSLALAGFLHGREIPVSREPETLVLGDVRVPLDGHGLMILSPYAPAPPREYSFAAVLQLMQKWYDTGELRKAEWFRGKHVVIGAKASELRDVRSTALNRDAPGVDIHATALANLLRRDFRRRAGPAVSVLWILLLSTLVGLAVGAFRLRTSIPVFAVLLSVTVSLNFVIFVQGRLWIDLVPAVLGGMVSLGAVSAFEYFTEGRQRRRVKRVFQAYVSPKVVNKVLDRPDAVDLAGERKELTIFFLDFEGFTSASEELEPEVLVDYLNRYHNEAVEEIYREEGTVDKFIGDAIMAFWGDPVDQPDQAARACRTAVRIQKRLQEMALSMKREGMLELRARIGLNTGVATAGNMGSLHQVNYTVIGDEVNLASRLEGVNKEFGTSILISETTWAGAKGEVETRKIGSVRVKGRRSAVGVYEILGLKDQVPEERRRRAREFEQALELFCGRKWDEAEAEFARLEGNGDRASEAYVRLCGRFRVNPPDADWQGEYVMEKK